MTTNTKAAPHMWEKVAEDVYRLDVPGGWIYSVDGQPSGLVYVPDPVTETVVSGRATDVVIYPAGNGQTYQAPRLMDPAFQGLVSLPAQRDLTARQTAQLAASGPGWDVVA